MWVNESRQELTELETDCTHVADFGGSPEAHLILRGPDRSEVVQLPSHGSVAVGRGEDSDVALEDGRVSRAHAKFYWASGELLLQDLGSRNGTLLNGVRLTGSDPPRSLKAGDRVKVGSHEFLVALVTKVPPPKRVESESGALLDGKATAVGTVVADARLTRTYGFARRIAASNATALILGETGTGKEVLAQQIHAWSKRKDGPLIRVNCAALPESLVESELFGHEKGAFTGADRRKVGLAEAANGGTFFLDEIGELPLPVQAKLLTMLENRAVVRLGSIKEVPIDIRVIAATHRDLSDEVAAGRFREDLFYRIHVAVLRIPPLRERLVELPLLAELFARNFAELSGAEPRKSHISPQALRALADHDWPGNIRELRNTIEHAMLVSEHGYIEVEHLPDTLGSAPSRPTNPPTIPTGLEAQVSIKAKVADLEREAIENMLRKKGGNRTHAALELGISLRSLLYKIKKYAISE